MDVGAYNPGGIVAKRYGLILATKKPGTRSKAAALDDIERRALTGAIVEQVGLTVRLGLMVAGACYFAYCLHLIATDLAGKITDANIALNVLGSLEFSVTVAWVWGLGASVYAVSQNRLRKRTVSKLTKRIQQLETIIDPSRTSSHLSNTGDTNPEDE